MLARHQGASRCRRLSLLLALAGCLAALPARAQRADTNVVTAAQDAFGTSVGYASIGLYSPSDARGFSYLRDEG